MGKQGGLGDNCYVDGYDMSGDVTSLQRVGGGPNLTEAVTGIKKLAFERIGLLRDGGIDFTSWFNDSTATGAEGQHTVLKTLPTADRIVSYFRGTAVGSPAASLVSKQVNFDGNRGNDASFTFQCNAQANGFGLEWGDQLTAGLKTDTTASNGTSIDFGSASTAFGWAAYLHVVAFTGTSVTVTVQDSADNGTFASLTGGAFTAATAIGAQRIASSSTTATVRRYVRIATSGTFSNAVFAVNFVRYLQAQS